MGNSNSLSFLAIHFSYFEDILLFLFFIHILITLSTFVFQPSKILFAYWLLSYFFSLFFCISPSSQSLLFFISTSLYLCVFSWRFWEFPVCVHHKRFHDNSDKTSFPFDLEFFRTFCILHCRFEIIVAFHRLSLGIAIFVVLSLIDVVWFLLCSSSNLINSKQWVYLGIDGMSYILS